jgi:hypothetical protein
VSNSVSSIWRGGIASVLSVALLALVGCGPAGPATVPVRGKITKDGKGVPGVIITLVGTDPNYIPTGESDDNGNFEITLAQSGKKGAMPGNYKVVLAGGGPRTPVGTPDNPVSPYGSGRQPAAQQKPYGPEYEAPDTTPLNIEVKSGMGPLDISL